MPVFGLIDFGPVVTTCGLPVLRLAILSAAMTKKRSLRR
jgi:hypothetical protein